MPDKPTPTYRCPGPGCARLFTASEKQGKNCPCGLLELIAERVRKDDGPGFTYIYKLADPDSPMVQRMISDLKKNGAVEQIKPKPSLDLDSEGYERISDLSEFPQVFKLPNENKFKVVYEGIVYTGWVYCPQCNKKLFQNMVASSPFAQEHKCPDNKCKAIIQFEFNPQVVGMFRR